MVGKGGRRNTTWNSQWNHGKTKHIRVPVALEQQIIEFARALDSGQGALDSQVLLLIDSFVESRIAQFHPNQYGRTGSITSRRWDELRKFRDAIAPTTPTTNRDRSQCKTALATVGRTVYLTSITLFSLSS